MVHFSCASKNATKLLLLSIAVVSIYIPLKMFIYGMPEASSVGTRELINAGTVIKHVADEQSKGSVHVAIKNVYPSDNGKVDLVLSLDMNELMKVLDKNTAIGSDATNNPVPHDVNWVIHNPDFCTEQQGLKYLIYVHSSPQNSDRRYNLRSTWAQRNMFKDNRTKLLFVMGQPENMADQKEVEGEMSKYGDILQGDFVDHYQNLTYKGLLALKWVSTHCQKAAYAVKADDDAFINIFKITDILELNQHRKRLVVCPQWKTMPILRDPSKCMKWCVKYSEFPGQNFFPRYCAGLSYALSREIIPIMHKAAAKTPFFWIDDVYITGLLTAKVPEMEYIDMLSNFCLKEDTAIEHFKDDARPLSDHYVHVKKPENFPKLWNLILNRLDKEELRKFTPAFLEKHPILKLKLA